MYNCRANVGIGLRVHLCCFFGKAEKTTQLIRLGGERDGISQGRTENS